MSEQNGILRGQGGLGVSLKKKDFGFSIIQITRGKGPILIGSLSVRVSWSHLDGERLYSR